MLEELKPIDNVALVSCEEEATSIHSLSRCSFSWRDFRSELDTTTNDTAILGGCVERRIFEISSRIGLASMRCERASVLRRWVAWKGVAEIVVARFVCPKVGVVVGWREIDGCSCMISLQSA